MVNRFSSYDRLYPDTKGRPHVRVSLGTLPGKPPRGEPDSARNLRYFSNGATRFADLILRHAVRESIDEGHQTLERIAAAWAEGNLIARAYFHGAFPPGSEEEEYETPAVTVPRYFGEVELQGGRLAITNRTQSLSGIEVFCWEGQDKKGQVFVPYSATAPFGPDGSMAPMRAVGLAAPYDIATAMHAEEPPSGFLEAVSMWGELAVTAGAAARELTRGEIVLRGCEIEIPL